MAILNRLQWKKWTIASIIWLINVWLVAKWLVDLDTATLIWGLSAVIFWWISYTTFKLNQPKDVIPPTTTIG